MFVVYITFYLEINRKDWKYFNRTFDQYLEEFLPFVEYMAKDKSNYILLVYMDDKHYTYFKNIMNDKNTYNILIKPISINNLVKNSKIWNLLEREREIMKSDKYKSIISHRSHCPETYIAEYTLINHYKIELIKDTINSFNNPDNILYIWMDFGWFKKDYLIPNKLIDPNKIDLKKINYTLLSSINERDFDIEYTLKNAPEKIMGNFFAGTKEKMIEYYDLYYSELKKFQELGYADDDQHLVLRCIYKKPELFKLHVVNKWGMAPLLFQL